MNLRRRLAGYDRGQVHQLVARLAARLEEARHALERSRARIGRLEAELERYRNEEWRLADVFVTAHREAARLIAEAEEKARRQGEARLGAILAAAHAEADEIIRAAEAERDLVEAEIRRLKGVEKALRDACYALLEQAIGGLEGEGARGSALQAAAPAAAELAAPSGSRSEAGELADAPWSEAGEPTDPPRAGEAWITRPSQAAPARPRARPRRHGDAVRKLIAAAAIAAAVGLIAWVASARDVPFLGRGAVDGGPAASAGASIPEAAAAQPAAETIAQEAPAQSAAVAALASSDRVLLAAGNIARCGPAGGDEGTAEILARYPDATIAALGDNAYEDGAIEEYEQCYGPSWGEFKHRTYPTTGDRDHRTANAAGYHAYFGVRGGRYADYFYSYDLGAWHVVVLNSDCWRIGGCDPNDRQARWLVEDLAQHPERCTLAYWHRPPFSSGRYGAASETRRVRPLWEAAYAAGVDVVLTGHEPGYERLAPMNPVGAKDKERGIRLFVVGTGGGDLSRYDTPPLPTTEVRQDHAWGVLKLTLHPESYDWEFLPVAGAAFQDSGSGACH